MLSKAAGASPLVMRGDGVRALRFHSISAIFDCILQKMQAIPVAKGSRSLVYPFLQVAVTTFDNGIPVERRRRKAAELQRTPIRHASRATEEVRYGATNFPYRANGP